jgi:hypothetical protein
MLTAVQLDHKPQARRIKIENKIADRVLPPEIDAQLSIAQLLPEAHFDLG